MSIAPADLSINPASGGVLGADPGKADVRGRSPGQLAWRRLRRDRVAIVSAVVLLVLVLLALGSPLILRLWGIEQNQSNGDLIDLSGTPKGTFGGVSGAHPFGIEPQLGRDLMGQVLVGLRTSLVIAVIVTVATTVIGVVAGVVAGYARGWVDGAISRLMDLFLAFPTLLFLIAVIPVLVQTFVPADQAGNGIRRWLLIIMLTLFGWASLARLMRGQTVVLRDREFIEAARAMGASSTHIVFRQLLPNLWAPILISVSLSVPTLVTTTAALSFLGVGIQEPIPDLGRTLQQSVNWISGDPAYFVFPAIVIVVLVLSFNLLGDSVRDALDPKSSR